MKLTENKNKLLLFVLIFNLLWIIRVLFIPKTQSGSFIISFTLKFLIFVLFPYFYVRLCYKENPVTAFKLNRFLKGAVYGLTCGLCVVILAIIVMVLSNGRLHLVTLNVKDMITCFVFAAFMEEIPFRGLILNKLNEYFGFAKSNIITSLLFVLIHVPGFINEGLFAAQAVIGSMIIIFITSTIFGYTFKKAGSLWAVIIFHGIYDCVVHVLGF